MKYTALFMEPAKVGDDKTINTFGQETYHNLVLFWTKYDSAFPSIFETARALKSIIVVRDENREIVATAFVHKSRVLGDRTKMLRKILIPEGTEGFLILKEIVELFAQQGREHRQAFIYDDLGDVGRQNRFEIYKTAGFTETQVLMMK
jgi:hypothetical protein